MLPLTYTLMNDLAATWARWKEETFGTGYHIWHEGLDVAVVTRLKGQARANAEAMLRLGRSLGDAHASEALAAMGDISTLAHMRAALLADDAQLSAGERVRTARLLHRLRPDPELAVHLVDVLRAPWSAGQPWSARVHAAIGLREFAGEDDEAALLAAVADPIYLVRYHAGESLLARYRARPQHLPGHPRIFDLIREPEDRAPTAADLARYADAARRLRALAPR
jgi:hypothetical protein